ncbi:MAG: nitroreductase family protein [Rikenellaceae bacterium]
MEFKEIVKKRRSIRKYSDKQVEQSTIDALLEVTLQAPSSRNSHSTHFMVIRNREIIEKMAQMRDYGSAFVKRAPIFILVMGDKEATDLWEVNCSISATMMQLSATDLGLSTCWVHVDGRPQLKEQPQGATAEEHLRSLVEIPANFGVLCGIAVGYSDFEPAALPEFDAAAHISTVL